MQERTKIIFVHVPKNAGSSFVTFANPRYTLHSSASHLKRLVSSESIPVYVPLREPHIRLRSNLRYALMDVNHPDHQIISKLRDHRFVLSILICLHGTFLGRSMLKMIGLKLRHPGWRSQRSFVFGIHKLHLFDCVNTSSIIDDFKKSNGFNSTDKTKRMKDTSSIEVAELPRCISYIRYPFDYYLYGKVRDLSHVRILKLFVPIFFSDVLRLVYQRIIDLKRPPEQWDLQLREQLE